MKRNSTIIGSCLLAVVALTGCSGKTDAPAAPKTGDQCQVSGHDLKVEAGKSCWLEKTKISGDVSLGEGSSISFTDVSVDGDLKGERQGAVTLSGGRVDGSVVLKNGGSVSINGVTVDGTLKVEGNKGAVTMSGNSVSDDLVCKDNDPAPTGDNNKVKGDKEEQCKKM